MCEQVWAMDLSRWFVGRKVTELLQKAAWKGGFHVTRKVNTLRSKRMDVIRQCGVEVVLDVGANAGQWAAVILDDGFRGKIISFEPHPEAFAKLIEKAWKNNVCLNIGLGSRDDTAQFYLTKESVNSSFMKPLDSAVRLITSTAVVSEQPLLIRSLDSVLSELGLTDDRLYLKIDVQGYEREVLLGASETLKKTVAIEIELSLTEMYNGQPLLPEVWDMLVALGFRPAWIEPGFRHPTDIWLMQIDVLFVREEAWRSVYPRDFGALAV